jgi:hypothetical protein
LEPATVESVIGGLNLDGFTYNEDEGAFIYFIPVEYNKAGTQISTDSITDYLKRLKWIDRQTRAVTLRFPVYNGNYMLFAIIEVRFEFELGGLVNKHLNINVMDLEAYSTQRHDVVPRMVCEVFIVLGVIFKIFGEIQDIIEAKKLTGSVLTYFTQWNIVDLTSIALYTLCIIYWVIYTTQCLLVEIPKPTPLEEDENGVTYDWAHETFLDELMTMTNNMAAARDSYTVYTLLTTLNLFCVLVVFFKFARFQPRLAVVNKTFAYALPDLLHFFVILIIVFVVFAVAGRVIFGAKWVEFATYTGAVGFLLDCMLNGVGLADFTHYGGGVGVFYYCVFMLLIFMLILNMFMGIVIGAYDQAQEEAGDAKNLLESFVHQMGTRWARFKRKMSTGKKVKPVTELLDEEIEDDTLGHLREVNIEWRLLVGKETARKGIPQYKLRAMLAERGVEQLQIDAMFGKFINHEDLPQSDDEGEGDEDDNYLNDDSEEEVEEAEAEPEKWASTRSTRAEPPIVDAIARQTSESVAQISKLQETIAKRETELMEREAHMEKREDDMAKELAEIKDMLKSIASK